MPAQNLEIEWRRAGVQDAVDLVVTECPRAAIEFKYPREPREKNAAWTQHLGELLKDFYRLAHMPTDFEERWCVQLLSPHVQSYLARVSDRLDVDIAQSPGHTTELRPDVMQKLPATARRSLDRWMADGQTIRARCVGVYDVGDRRLVVHDVERSTLHDAIS